MAIKVKTHSKKHKASVRLYSTLIDFSFSQQYDEMENWSKQCVDAMKTFMDLLSKEIT